MPFCQLATARREHSHKVIYFFRVKEKFNGLSNSVKTKIYGGKFSGLTEEEINTLNKNQLRMLVPVSKEYFLCV